MVQPITPNTAQPVPQNSYRPGFKYSFDGTTLTVSGQHNINVNDTSEMNDLKAKFAPFLADLVSPGALDRAFQPGGAMFNALASNTEELVTLRDLNGKAAAPSLAPRGAAPKSVQPTPPKPTLSQTQKREKLKPMVDAPATFTSDEQRAQWQVYAQGKAMVAAKFQELMNREATPQAARDVHTLVMLDNNLNFAAEHLQSKPIYAPLLVSPGASDRLANTLFAIAYFNALPKNTSWPTFEQHKAAETAAYKMFGPIEGDPLLNFYDPSQLVSLFNR